jgi:hypothetical protein
MHQDGKHLLAGDNYHRRQHWLDDAGEITPHELFLIGEGIAPLKSCRGPFQAFFDSIAEDSNHHLLPTKHISEISHALLALRFQVAKGLLNMFSSFRRGYCFNST